ncbi:copper homeostasis protein cutC homolog [Chelonus insularis]|uniref:copper homeostasis protein cutC homolog n=1 Tax=Chelonus insularis TaxID=460826 RepID=UPI00158ACDDE|nr:copper homeostasis protein cutC homolog [Chelonus insularis]
MEICIDSIESAKNAIRGGATRLEACSALSEDGLTPTPGLIRFIKQFSNVPVYAMIRIRSGNFIYTHEEKQAMLYDLAILKDAGADGFVFGALNQDKTINYESCREIISAVGPEKHVTFHRAFDEVKDPIQALEELVKLGFERVLTSGQKKIALEGLPLITDLIKHAKNRIIVMPGSGINPENIAFIKNTCKAKEFHASARIRIAMENETLKANKIDDLNLHYINVASEELVRKMVDIINS